VWSGGAKMTDFLMAVSMWIICLLGVGLFGRLFRVPEGEWHTPIVVSYAQVVYFILMLPFLLPFIIRDWVNKEGIFADYSYKLIHLDGSETTETVSFKDYGILPFKKTKGEGKL
jgi:hypothetical protein